MMKGQKKMGLVALRHGHYDRSDPERRLTPLGEQQILTFVEAFRPIMAALDVEPAIVCSMAPTAIETGSFLSSLLAMPGAVTYWNDLWDDDLVSGNPRLVQELLPRFIEDNGLVIAVTHQAMIPVVALCGVRLMKTPHAKMMEVYDIDLGEGFLVTPEGTACIP